MLANRFSKSVFALNTFSSPLSLATPKLYSTLNEAEKIRKRDELIKQRALAAKERSRKLKEKKEAKEKLLRERQLARFTKKEEQTKKWLLEQKIKEMREKEEAKEALKREKQKQAEKERKEKEKHKQALKKFQDNQTKKKGTKKDPNAPVRAMTSMLWYVKQNFATIKKELEDGGATGVSAVAVVKEAKKRMETLTPEEKSKYELLAKQDSERYQREMENYRKRKQSEKKPLSSYFLFTSEKRDEEKTRLGDLKNEKGEPLYSGRTLQLEIAKALGQRWQALSNEEKEAYKQRYQQVYKEYTEKHQKSADGKDYN